MFRQLSLRMFLAAGVLFFCCGHVMAQPPNPCQRASIECRPGEGYLEVRCVIELDNDAGEAADVTLLRGIDVMVRVEGQKHDLVLRRVGADLQASVPKGFRGEVTVLLRQRITREAGRPASRARLPLAPAVVRKVTFDSPDPDIELEAAPKAIVRKSDAVKEGARFTILPIEGDALTLSWRPVIRVGRRAFTLTQIHRISELAPAYEDRVEATLSFGAWPPESVRLTLPARGDLKEVGAPDSVRWHLKDGALVVEIPASAADSRLSLRLLIEGETAARTEAGWALPVPLLNAPDAERSDGQVLVTGRANELSFAELKGATQSAAGSENGRRWKLACRVQRADARVVVRIVPMPARPKAELGSIYDVSAFQTRALHRLAVQCPVQPLAHVTVKLAPGEVVQSLQGQLLKGWSQDGATLNIETAVPAGGVAQWLFTTERLLSARVESEQTAVKEQILPPSVAGMASARSAMGVRLADDVQAKQYGPGERHRVKSEALPDWIKALSPALAYAFPDAAVPVQLELLPVVAHVTGSVQDHVTVLEDRIRRETLFLLDVQKRPLRELEIVLPEALNVEEVGGPSIEDWNVAPGNRLTVRFRGPVTGKVHCLLTSGRAVQAGTIVVEGIRLAIAPDIKGWLGVGPGVSVAVRPTTRDQAAISSVRADTAPSYLKPFGDKLLYETYGAGWKLTLQSEIVPAVFTTDTLNVVRFRAAQARATALINVTVLGGGVGELRFALPPGATGSSVQAPNAVEAQLKEGVWHVRLGGRRTGTFTCRADYSLVAGAGESALAVGPVGLRGAREEGGLLLLTQARPDVEVRVGETPRALSSVEAAPEYPRWSYMRSKPVVAAFTYRSTDWRLPLNARSLPLSQVMLNATVPLAQLHTAVTPRSETLNHLRLFVANTNRQFLTVDMARLGPGARLIGTYAQGKPVKPFREGASKLHLPLFAAEIPPEEGISVLDITYALPAEALAPLRRHTLTAPDLGLNVGEFEWSVGVPWDARILAVEGSMDKPSAVPPPMPSVAARMLSPVWDLVWPHRQLLAGIALVLAGCVLLVWFLRRVNWAQVVQRTVSARAVATVFVALFVIAILAAMLMPAMQTAKESARGGGSYSPRPSWADPDAADQRGTPAAREPGKFGTAKDSTRDMQRAQNIHEQMGGQAARRPAASPALPGEAEAADGIEQKASFGKLADGKRKTRAEERYNLGQEYMRRGQYDRAAEQFKRALELDADQEDARRRLAQSRTLLAQAGEEHGAQGEQPPGPGTEDEDDDKGLEAALEKRETEMEEEERLRQSDVGRVDVDPDDTGGGPEVPAQPWRAPALWQEARGLQTIAGAQMPRATSRRSLAKRISGGRTVGVLPIEIEFPVAPSVDYAFARPLLGRSGAEIRFRTVTAGQAMFVELGLSALALVLLLLVKLRRPAAAANAAAGLFVISLALLLLVPGPAATMFAATALATGICFAAEAIHQIIIRIREPQPKEV